MWSLLPLIQPQCCPTIEYFCIGYWRCRGSRSSVRTITPMMHLIWAKAELKQPDRFQGESTASRWVGFRCPFDLHELLDSLLQVVPKGVTLRASWPPLPTRLLSSYQGRNHSSQSKMTFLSSARIRAPRLTILMSVPSIPSLARKPHSLTSWLLLMYWMNLSMRRQSDILDVIYSSLATKSLPLRFLIASTKFE